MSGGVKKGWTTDEERCRGPWLGYLYCTVSAEMAKTEILA